MDKRLGFIGIILNSREESAVEANELLSDFGEIIVARMGLPYDKKGCSVIVLIVDTTTDSLGTLTGRLGALDGVSVKSGLSKE